MGHGDATAYMANAILLKEGTFFILRSWSIHENGLLLLQPTLCSFGVHWEKQEGMLQAIAVCL